MLTMLTCWWWARLIHHFTTHVVYVFMTVHESQSFTKLITIHPIVFERFLRKSKEIIRSVGTCSHSRRFRFISQIRKKDDVCSSVSVDLTLFKWHKRAAGLRRICGNLIWFALQTSHFGFGSDLQKWLHILCFFLPKIDLGTIWIC